VTAGIFDTAGLVQSQSVEFGDLIRADHQCVLDASGGGLRFCHGKS